MDAYSIHSQRLDKPIAHQQNHLRLHFPGIIRKVGSGPDPIRNRPFGQDLQHIAYLVLPILV